MAEIVWDGSMAQVMFERSREALFVCDAEAVVHSSNQVAQKHGATTWQGKSLPEILGLEPGDWAQVSLDCAVCGEWNIVFDCFCAESQNTRAEAKLVPLAKGLFLLSIAAAKVAFDPAGGINLAGSNIASDIVKNALKFQTMYLAEEQRASTDALTGLKNRRAFEESIMKSFVNAESFGIPFSLIIIDVDHFKKFNDTHGHVVGDAVLKGIGATLQAGTRNSDTVHRIGGEEFVILLDGAPKIKALEVAERTRSLVETTEIAGLHVTVSAGVITCEGAGWDSTTLIHAADEALYASKAAGRNRVTHYGELKPDAREA